MKKFSGSVVVGLLLMSGLAVAGGDIAPVEPEVVVPAPPPVVDESGPYLGVAYSAARYRGDTEEAPLQDIKASFTITSGERKVDYDGIMAQAGYKFNQYLALEGRYWWSLGDSDWSYAMYGGKGELGPHESGSEGNEELRAWGVYLKPMYPVTEQFDVYALLGYGGVKLSNDSHGDWLDENDFQWGLGASYEFTENISIFVDYVRLLDESNTRIWYEEPRVWDDEVYTINVGLTYKF